MAEVTPITPTMGEGLAHPDGPPSTLKDSNFELYNYLQMIHSHIFGLGGDTGDISAFHEVGTHKEVSQGAAVANLAGDAGEVTQILVELADAAGGYDAAERDLINELKADLNSLIAEYNILVATLNAANPKTTINALLASLRAAGVIAT